MLLLLVQAQANTNADGRGREVVRYNMQSLCKGY